jgi:ATP-dependent Clp protease protease subunit
LERINQDTDRDFYLNAEEAIAYGLVDQIVERL